MLGIFQEIDFSELVYTGKNNHKKMNLQHAVIIVGENLSEKANFGNFENPEEILFIDCTRKYIFWIFTFLHFISKQFPFCDAWSRVDFLPILL